MTTPQPGILAGLPTAARFSSFSLIPESDPLPGLRKLARRPIADDLVVGIGAPLAMALGADLPGMRSFPASSGPGFAVPSTQSALCCWIRGEDRGHIMHAAQAIELTLEEAYEIEDVVDTFVHDGGRDLTGYVDGTENPTGDRAREVGIVSGAGAGLDGSSYLAVQRWNHDLQLFSSFTARERDEIIGRTQKDDIELEDAPATAHVKRTAQEDFDPEAFLVRRSMPWADADGEGLLFVAFATSFDPYEAQLRRMTGAEDGIVDALFRFTRPTSGSFHWCPPLVDGKLDLRALGIR